MSSSDHDNKLDLDVLAGFIDGTLSAQARARVIEALDTDEQALELFSETLLNVLAFEEFPTDTGPGETNVPVTAKPEIGRTDSRVARLTPHGGPSDYDTCERVAAARAGRGPSFWRSTLARVAAVVLVAVAAVVAHFLPLTQSPSELDALVTVGLLEGDKDRLDQAWSDHGWSATRGPRSGLAAGARAFRLGVLVVDLQIALASENVDRATTITYGLQHLLADVDFASPLVRSYGELRDRLPNRDYETLAELNAKTARLVELEIDSASFRLGQWSEASRLAARLGDPEYFSRSNFQRELRRLSEEASGRAQPELARLREMIRDGASARDLELTLESIISVGGSGP